jgi:hypothetical protein
MFVKITLRNVQLSTECFTIDTNRFKMMYLHRLLRSSIQCLQHVHQVNVEMKEMKRTKENKVVRRKRIGKQMLIQFWTPATIWTIVFVSQTTWIKTSLKSKLFIHKITECLLLRFIRLYFLKASVYIQKRINIWNLFARTLTHC